MRFAVRMCGGSPSSPTGSAPDRSEPAHLMTLRTSRRCSVQILDVSRRVAALLGAATGLPVNALRAHRALEAPVGHPVGDVEVRLFPTVEREAVAIAEILRREHLHRGTPWSQMAVLVRSGLTGIPVLSRALGAAGVPVEVATDELPLRDHPALAPLLTLLGVASNTVSMTPEAANELLLSPLVGGSPSEVRRLGGPCARHIGRTLTTIRPLRRF